MAVIERLHILQHALGVDEYGRDGKGRITPTTETYRNHFVTDDDSDDGPICNALVRDGLMVRHPPRDISGGMPTFVVTEAGRALVADLSPRAPKISRAERRYSDWLLESDATGEKFGEYLKRISRAAR